jgi:uncharacterized coiled-coil protein SlyX
MSRNNNKDRYSVDEILIRLSDKTKQGMNINIDALAAFGRVLSIQDDAYEGRFEGIEKFMHDQILINREILSTLKELKGDILDLKVKVAGLDTKIGELSKIVNATAGQVDQLKEKVDCLDKDVAKLKRATSVTAVIIKIAIGIAIAIPIIGLVFHLF